MERKYLSDDGLSLYSESKKEDIQIGTSRSWGGFFDLDSTQRDDVLKLMDCHAMLAMTM